MNKRSLIIVLAAVAIAGAGAYGAWKSWDGAGDAPKYRLAKAESGPLTAAVSATGTLNPVVSVQVGSQVSGQIKEILVDFNSPVKSGQLIARLDPETYQHRVRQAEADVDAARAAQGVQQAEVSRARASLSNAQRDYERKKTLVEKNFISPAERDTAQNTLDAARASLASAEAQVKNGEAIVRQREAQLAAARVDLERTSIKSPVDGIVVKRSIEPGQTVAASLQAPELFVIARNLTDMQVETSIDEADVGRVRLGQTASFTVDAFAGRRFEGEVRQIRKAATVVSNVVTYTVVISTANPDLGLLPGMTANVRIVTAQKDKVLKVPNAALRFRPADGGDEKKAAAAVSPAPTSAAAGPKGAGAGRGGGGGSGSGRVWIVGDDGKAKAVEIRIGLTDGSMTEILSGDIKEGQEVIAGQQTAAKPPSMPGPRLF